jgi:hypothetical protein
LGGGVGKNKIKETPVQIQQWMCVYENEKPSKENIDILNEIFTNRNRQFTKLQRT